MIFSRRVIGLPLIGYGCFGKLVEGYFSNPACGSSGSVSKSRILHAYMNLRLDIYV